MQLIRPQIDFLVGFVLLIDSEIALVDGRRRTDDGLIDRLSLWGLHGNSIKVTLPSALQSSSWALVSGKTFFRRYQKHFCERWWWLNMRKLKFLIFNFICERHFFHVSIFIWFERNSTMFRSHITNLGFPSTNCFSYWVNCSSRYWIFDVFVLRYRYTSSASVGLGCCNSGVAQWVGSLFVNLRVEVRISPTLKFAFQQFGILEVKCWNSNYLSRTYNVVFRTLEEIVDILKRTNCEIFLVEM